MKQIDKFQFVELNSPYFGGEIARQIYVKAQLHAKLGLVSFALLVLFRVGFADGDISETIG